MKLFVKGRSSQKGIFGGTNNEQTNKQTNKQTNGFHKFANLNSSGHISFQSSRHQTFEIILVSHFQLYFVDVSDEEEQFKTEFQNAFYIYFVSSFSFTF